jgi:EpsI family protein
MAVTAVFSLNIFSRQRVDKDEISIKEFPYEVLGYKAEDVEITEMEYEILETRNLLLRNYKNEAGEIIQLFIVYSETNRSVFHPPEVCMIGGGIQITDKKQGEVTIRNNEYTINELFLDRSDSKDIALYVYKAGDFYTDNYLLHQILFSFNQLLGKRRSGATIRVWMPLAKDKEYTLSRLRPFLKETIRLLETM